MKPGRFDTLFCHLEGKLGRDVTAGDMVCEELDQRDLPGGWNGELGRLLTLFRRQTQDQRRARIRSFHRRMKEAIDGVRN